MGDDGPAFTVEEEMYLLALFRYARLRPRLGSCYETASRLVQCASEIERPAGWTVEYGEGRAGEFDSAHAVMFLNGKPVDIVWPANLWERGQPSGGRRRGSRLLARAISNLSDPAYGLFTRLPLHQLLDHMIKTGIYGPVLDHPKPSGPPQR